MNEYALAQLMVIVDRTVQAVRVRASRKREMREELLAHVCAVFEEEVARLGDERAALERTAQRFGDPAELTGQLEESITAAGYIGWAVDRVWFWLPGCGMVNHNRLYNAILIIFGFYILCGVGLLTIVMGMPHDARPHSLLPNWSLPILTVLNGFYLVAMVVTLMSRLAGPSIGKRITKAMNLLLLMAPPFGTILGIYGLWKVDKKLEGGLS